MYYNTTNHTGNTLVEYHAKADSQDQFIEQFFKAAPWQTFGASNIQPKMAQNTPITSVRRSLNGLIEKGVIEKVGRQMGAYGRTETTYRLKQHKQAIVEPDGQTALFA